MRKWILSSLVLWLVIIQGGHAEIYQWQDEQGKRHYSDKPQGNAEIVHINPGYSYFRIKNVYDGDTVQLDDGRKIRLLGINTPEVESRNKSTEAGGEEAKAWLAKTLKNARVRLIFDVEKKDKYNRTLAHLVTEHKDHINFELVKAGLAAVNIYPPNLAFTDNLLAAQSAAETSGLGIWARPEYAVKELSQISKNSYKGWQRLSGQISDIRYTRKFAYLNFSEQFNCRIERKHLALFSELESYVGRSVEVRGWLNREKGRFSMLIRHPSSIRVKQDEE